MTLKWGYKRAFLRCALLFLAGTTLQLAVGDFDNSFLRYPWGLILAINYCYILILISSLKNKWKWLGQLGDGYACISSLASMIVLTIIFGLTRQDSATEGIVGALGFSRMTSSWGFNLLLFYFTTTLGLAVIDDFRHLRKRRVAAVMSHAAVFIILAASMFGSADKQRVMATLPLDKVVDECVTQSGERVQLPFTMSLREFSMEEYPPKLYILDVQTESSSADFLLVESEGDEAEVDSWKIKAVKSVDMAGRMPDEQEYKPMNHVGAAPAVYVVAEKSATGEHYEGWVSCGSHIFEPSYLVLGKRYAVAMPRREAKRYLSKVVVADDEGMHNFDIEVNHPARIGSWRIYQVGYDTSRGRWSTYSVLECVRDGWYSVIHIALWMLLATGVVMFATAGGRKIANKKARKGDKI